MLVTISARCMQVEVRRELRNEAVLLVREVRCVLGPNTLVQIFHRGRVCYSERVEFVELQATVESGAEVFICHMPLVDVDVENRGKSTEDWSSIEVYVDALKDLGFQELSRGNCDASLASILR